MNKAKIIDIGIALCGLRTSSPVVAIQSNPFREKNF